MLNRIRHLFLQIALTIGLLLCDWLRSIENEPPSTVLANDEQKVLSVIKELLAEADISIGDSERLSAATLNIWAGTLDNVWVWGRTPIKVPFCNNSYPHSSRGFPTIRRRN